MNLNYMEESKGNCQNSYWLGVACCLYTGSRTLRSRCLLSAGVCSVGGVMVGGGGGGCAGK